MFGQLPPVLFDDDILILAGGGTPSDLSTSCVVLSATKDIPLVPVTMVATGGVAPYLFSASGLPPGVTLGSTGLISGTPTASGTFPYLVTLFDNVGSEVQITCSVTVGLAPTGVVPREVFVASTAKWNKRLPKFAGERYPVGMDFRDLIPAGETIQTSSHVKAYDSAGTDVTNTLLEGYTISGTQVVGILQGGVMGGAYVIEFFAVTENYTLEDNITMFVLSDKF